jgi:hypothetical protein
MVDLQNNLEDFQAANIQPVVLLMGTPEQAAPLVEKYQLTMPVLCDPYQEAYKAYKIPQGTPSQYLGWRIWLPGLRAMFRGGMGKPVGDVTQMHGTILVNTDGNIQTEFIATNSAHYPSLDNLTST